MTYNVFSGTLNPTHSLTHSLDGTQNLESYVDNVVGHTKELKEHMKILRDSLTKC